MASLEGSAVLREGQNMVLGALRWGTLVTEVQIMRPASPVRSSEQYVQKPSGISFTPNQCLEKNALDCDSFARSKRRSTLLRLLRAKGVQYLSAFFMTMPLWASERAVQCDQKRYYEGDNVVCEFNPKGYGRLKVDGEI